MTALSRRAAGASDIPELLRMGERFHHHAGFRVAFDRAHFRRFLSRHIGAPGSLALVLAPDVPEPDGAGALAGMLLALAFPHPLLACRAAVELAWWVDPEHRGGGSLGMVRDYEAWARGMNCALVALSSLDGLAGDRIGRVYARLGFVRTEQSFMKWLVPAHTEAA